MLNKDKNFIGCDALYKDADIVLFGAPFDGTTTYRPGARFAYSRMCAESYGIETYSPYVDRDLSDMAICDAGELELPFGNTEKVLDEIEITVGKIIADKKIPFMIGGEHLVSLGAVRAAVKKYKDLCVIQFDAHTDLREDYLGEKLSHSTVIRRIHELVGDQRIFQYGIRSGEKYEFEFAAKHTTLVKNNFEGLKDCVKKIGGRPVYFTLDLDVLDPSEFPGTGTPEAGGVSFLELLKAISTVAELNVIGMDINELCPPYDHSGISTALACKITRELLLTIFK